jgi:hypothetical protein
MEWNPIKLRYIVAYVRADSILYTELQEINKNVGNKTNEKLLMSKKISILWLWQIASN